MPTVVLKSVFAAAFIFLCTFLNAQDSSRLDKMMSLPDKLFGALDKKARDAELRLDRQTSKYLSKLQRQEHKLKQKLAKTDSLLAEQSFGDIDKRYEELKNTSGRLNRFSSVYSGHLDSLSTALSFLKSSDLSNLSSNPDLERCLSSYQQLQSKLNLTDQIRKRLLERQSMLKAQFEKLGMVKKLKQFRKQVFYYQAQLREYKAAFEDPTKLEAKLIELVMKLPEFKDFFASNSVLGSLFALPGSSSLNSSSVAVVGLQTRAAIQQSLVDRFGTGANVTQMLGQNMQSAQGQMNVLRSRLGSFSSGSYGNGNDFDMPDGFKPNGQATKSFLQRLEYGANIQSQKARYFFPVTSDVGLSLGYKINDKSSVGIGASYKVGWGRGWDNISISHQGVGLRSYLDVKIKGSFFVSGGYEQNYKSVIHSVNQLKDFSSWQTSGLLGLSKKYKLNKNLKAEMKLLWDFLSYRQVPRTQAILFRIGYSFK